MSQELFPLIQPTLSLSGSELPLYREIMWDYKNNIPIWRGGEPLVITGAQAVLSWAYRALQVVRFRYEIYSWDYGNECENLIGTAYTDELKQAEAKRYVRECLLTNPYITDVRNIKVDFSLDTLSINFEMTTIYGEVEVNV